MPSIEEETCIPVIDLGPFTIPGYNKLTKDDTVKKLAKVCETLGCFYVKNHGVDSQLVKDTITDHRLFFAQPQEYKLQFIDPLAGRLHSIANRGYIPYETQNINMYMGRKSLPNDPIEKYHLAPPDRDPSKLEHELWPDYPPTFKANLSKYFDGMTALSEVLMHALSMAMDAPGYEDFVYENCRFGAHRMKEHLYPPNAEKKPNQDARFPEHTDAAPFAILATSMCSSGTLHAFDEINKKWISIDSSEDMFVVNLGDSIARWTNGAWIAPIHKVAWPETKEDIGRVSLVFFAHANGDVVLKSIPKFVKEGEQPKYEPLPYYDLIEKRQKKIQADALNGY